MDRFNFDDEQLKLYDTVKNKVYDCTDVSGLFELSIYLNKMNVLDVTKDIQIDNCKSEMNKLKIGNEMLRRVVEDLRNNISVWHN